MLKKVYLGVAILAMAATPVFAADECGPTPIPPAFPTVSELAAKTVEDARKDVYASFHLVKNYQASLKTFRGCLEQLTKTDTDDIDAAKAKAEDAKVTAAQDRIAARQAIYDKTLNSEEQVANEFNTLRLTHCGRDTDTKVCPQPKK
jgi:hypothetical protein